jgi:hypothetical protein
MIPFLKGDVGHAGDFQPETPLGAHQVRERGLILELDPAIG